jgi:hypothetical protein
VAIRTVTIGPRPGGGIGGKATFGVGIGAPQPVGEDLAPHYMVRRAGRLFECLGNAKVAPTGAPLYIDVLRSQDEGDTWESVFPAGNDNKLVIPAGSAKQHSQTTFAEATRDLSVGDWLRIDLLAGSASNAQDIEVVLRWAK